MSTKQKTLQEQLEAALADQDYEQAAILRDRINGTQVDKPKTADDIISDMRKDLETAMQANTYVRKPTANDKAYFDDIATNQRNLNKAIVQSQVEFEGMIKSVWPAVLVAAVGRILADHRIAMGTDMADSMLVKVSYYDTMTADIYYGPDKLLVLRRRDSAILIELP